MVADHYDACCSTEQCVSDIDPSHNRAVQDAAEKALMKVATRGVVRLFNAVSKAQKQTLEESIVGKRAKVSRGLGG